jgi:hypothetical protein
MPTLHDDNGYSDSGRIQSQPHKRLAHVKSAASAVRQSFLMQTKRFTDNPVYAPLLVTQTILFVTLQMSRPIASGAGPGFDQVGCGTGKM